MKGILFAVIICAVVRGASLITSQTNGERKMSKQWQAVTALPRYLPDIDVIPKNTLLRPSKKFGSATNVFGNLRTTSRKHDDDDDIIIIIQNILKSSWRPSQGTKASKTSPECTTHECIKQSMNMSRMMDPTADPCTDFYQYACGGWVAQPLPPDKARWSVFGVMAEQTEYQLRDIIEKQKDSVHKVARKIYNWYASCTNKTERDRLGPTPLLELIHQTMKSKEFTPFVIHQWPEGEWSVEETLASVHRKLGVSPLFKVSLDMDPRNSSSPTHLALSTARPLLSSEAFYISEDPHAKVVIEAYASLLVRLTVLLGGSHQPKEQVIQALKGILQFEVDVIKEAQKKNAREGQIAVWTIKDLQENIPGFDWRRYFTVLLEGISNETLLQRETIFIETPWYLKNIFQLIKNTPKGTIANFIVWNIVYKFGPYLSTDFHNAYLEFARKSYGIRRSSPLWQRCVRSADKSMDLGVAFLFVNDSGMGNESLIYADKMVQQIRQAFLDNLKSVTWMDDQTKRAAKIKAKAMFQQIGYPEFIMNSTLLELYFAGLKVEENSYFKNRLREISLRMKNTLLMRGQPLDRYGWEMNPDEVNAYYSPTNNKIVVPAGILRPPFYHVQHPHAENFGAIGFVVGHELTHGFDSNGAMYDDQGNLANWWTKASLAHFYAREECLVEEYNQCQIQGFHLSGKKTLGENTADNGGLKLAYQAYQKWLEKHDHDTTLPNLGLNSDQLFFLSFAQIWCERVTPDYALNDLASNSHSPGKFRVDVTLKNNKDFARAFNCPYGTKMNPPQKCVVW